MLGIATNKYPFFCAHTERRGMPEPLLVHFRCYNGKRSTSPLYILKSSRINETSLQCAELGSVTNNLNDLK